MGAELFIAGKYLRAKRKEGFISLITLLSVAGVILGVMALVVVIAVMSGSETEFRNRILGLEPHILAMNYSGHFTPDPDMEDKIRQTAGVTAVSPILFGQAMIRTTNAFSGIILRGIEPEKEAALIKGYTPEDLENALSETTITKGLPGIILGQSLAHAVGVMEGDRVILMSASGIISPMGHIPSMKQFVVTGTFKSGMSEYDSSLAYARLDQVQALVSAKGKVSAFGIWTDQIFKVKKISQNELGFIEYPYYLRNWMDINQSLFSALKLEKTAMFVILTLIILVAAFNIASALIMMVMEKTRDIAVLKAMGATNAMIRRIFIIKGMIIGIIGTGFGTTFGVVICYILKRYEFIKLPEAYPFTTLPVQLEFSDVILTAVSALLICFLSTLYPSYKASRMNPVEAIRYG
ncbi:lipoprotein-releasing ABC transporter permease subunit [Desulfobacter latus]|uniref:Lipoprotein-releasing ABC transporter permease subunit n=1 Tax=Desulfobacter latus TaxID=2292 RepID=A0A850T7G8_9BACT|nr:lipoprotein-releasing ABC transporter permease subunit [Desulfobacter latus]